MGALILPVGKKPRFAAVYTHDTDESIKNRKHFYGLLRKDLLRRLGHMLHKSNKLVWTFLSLRDLVHWNRIPQDVKIEIHAQERKNSGHKRKYNVPEAS